MASQPLRQQPPPPPSTNGMQGMTSQQPAKDLNFVFVKGTRRSRVASEDSDDSDISSAKGEGSSTGNPKKKLSTGDEKMDEEEKRKNFLERNRQGNKPNHFVLILRMLFPHGSFVY